MTFSSLPLLHIKPTCFTLHSSPTHITGAGVRSCAVPSILAGAGAVGCSWGGRHDCTEQTWIKTEEQNSNMNSTRYNNKPTDVLAYNCKWYSFVSIYYIQLLPGCTHYSLFNLSLIPFPHCLAVQYTKKKEVFVWQALTQTASSKEMSVKETHSLPSFLIYIHSPLFSGYTCIHHTYINYTHEGHAFILHSQLHSTQTPMMLTRCKI